MPDSAAAVKAQNYLKECMKQQDSAGGVVECVIKNLPAGLGDPVFEKLDANLAKAIFSIGAVKSFEIGDGIEVTKTTGKANNDNYHFANGSIEKNTNHSGGILGGISDGSDLILRAGFKPTPSISATQHTVNKAGETIEINVKGRHDPIIVPRAVVVVESMTAITLVDALLMNMGARMEYVTNLYKR
jgi:chorismate synthase